MRFVKENISRELLSTENEVNLDIFSDVIILGHYYQSNRFKSL
jgi:hypothetical protein